jgi:hypothetical protein
MSSVTSKLRVDKGVSAVRTGKPLSTQEVNRTIARVRRERDRDNLGGHFPKPPKSAKRSEGHKTSVSLRLP